MDLCTVSPAHRSTTSALGMKESHQDSASPSPPTDGARWRSAALRPAALSLSLPMMNERELGSVSLAVPVGGWSPCGISGTSCPEGQQAWAVGPPRGLSLCVPFRLSSPPVVFLAVSVDSPHTPFFLNTIAKHLEEK